MHVVFLEVPAYNLHCPAIRQIHLDRSLHVVQFSAQLKHQRKRLADATIRVKVGNWLSGKPREVVFDLITNDSLYARTESTGVVRHCNLCRVERQHHIPTWWQSNICLFDSFRRRDHIYRRQSSVHSVGEYQQICDVNSASAKATNSISGQSIAWLHDTLARVSTSFDSHGILTYFKCNTWISIENTQIWRILDGKR